MQAPDRSTMDQLFIDKVNNATSTLVDNRTMEKDERSRTSVPNRDVQVNNARYTDFNFKAGDRVSLEGKSYIMLTNPKTDPSSPGSVLVSEEFNTEKTKKVMHDQLKAPGDQRKVHRIAREQPVAKADFIFAQIDSIVKAGVVTEDDDLVQFHEYLKSPAMHSWFPAWETTIGQIIRATKPPNNSKPVCWQTKRAQILHMGTLDRHKLDEHLIKGLEARGVVAVITTIYRLDVYSIDASIQVCMGTDPTGQQFACLFDTGAEISIMNSNGPQFERMTKWMKIDLLHPLDDDQAIKGITGSTTLTSTVQFV